MISYNEVLAIHWVLINKFGGLHGLRDENALKSAIERPFGGYGNNEFYPSPEEKAGAILESVIKNHPFVDGNKRTGYVLMILLLLNFEKDILANQDEKYAFVMAVASGQYDFNQITSWIKKRMFNRHR